MKKAIGMLVCIMCLFSACTAAGDGSSAARPPVSSGADGAEEGAPVSAAEDGGILTGELRRASLTTYGCESDTGFYRIEHDSIQPEGPGFMTYIDYAARKQQYLCSKPGCAHQDETCNSYIPFHGSGEIVCYLENELVLMIEGNPFGRDNSGEGGEPRIERMDLNGENRRVLATFEQGTYLPLDQLYYDDGYLYLAQYSNDWLRQPGEEPAPPSLAAQAEAAGEVLTPEEEGDVDAYVSSMRLVRVNRESGEVQTLREYRKYDSLVTMADSCFFIKRGPENLKQDVWDTLEKEAAELDAAALPEEEKQEKSEELSRKYEELQNNQPMALFSYSLKTGEETQARAWKWGDQPSDEKYLDGNMYYLNKERTALMRWDAKTGEDTELADVPQFKKKIVHFESILDGKLSCVLFPMDVDSPMEVYGVDLQSGTLTPVTMYPTIILNGVVELDAQQAVVTPPSQELAYNRLQVMGETPDSFLVVSKQEIRDNGQEYYENKEEYALVSKVDYWQGKPNYIAVETLFAWSGA